MAHSRDHSTPRHRQELAPPSQTLDGLYGAVAASGIFPDFKHFADAAPREAPATIVARYRLTRPDSNETLRAFIKRHFIFDDPFVAVALPAPGLSIQDHIERLWPALTRDAHDIPPHASLLALPKPYIVPGGRFRELYYWDSYFTMLGLGPNEQSLRNDMLDDFVYAIRTYGFIPNGNRTYYLSRSQPPFFFEMVALTAPDDPPRAFAHFLPEMKAEYAFWMRGEKDTTPGHASRNVVHLPDGAVLNRYWDERDTPRDEQYPNDVDLAEAARAPAAELYRNIRAAAESGWDFSSRWLADKTSLTTIETTSILPVDLNSLLYGLERAIEAGCARKNDASCEKEFAKRAGRRREAMNRYFWNAQDGAYDDYDWVRGERRDVLSAATLYPLFTGAADDAQARAVAATVRAKLLAPGGLATTTNRTGQQWDAPNGWAPLQWIAAAGLRRYGLNGLADEIKRRWLATVERAYDKTGRLVEKYNVNDPEREGGGGEYPLQDGFGWTNGVTAAFLNER